MTNFRIPRWVPKVAVYLCAVAVVAGTLGAQSGVTDPGPRGGSPGAGGPAAGLGADYVSFFSDARARVQQTYSVSGGVAGEDGAGLGPTFNGNSCAMCHAEPAVGGSSRLVAG